MLIRGIKKKNSGTVYNITPAIVASGVSAMCDRWLRFDPANRKGLIIKGGTALMQSNGGIKYYKDDTRIDLSSQLSSVGANYFVYLQDDGTITVSTSGSGSGVKIGRFHTLCVYAGTMTMIAPSNDLAVGGDYLVKPYNAERDPDFYALYNKRITAVTTQEYYDVATMAHPLSGYQAGDILPESIFCLTFYPDCLVEDAMVYDRGADRCVDVYLQSGKGHATRSAYGATHTVSRQQPNHASDYNLVGKRLLNDHEFASMALGSNEATNIVGSSDKGTVGGHSDTNGRRMISAIGVEEACGYLWQWLNDIPTVTNTGDYTAWANADGNGSFGKNYWMPHGLRAGGHWYNATDCCSRSRNSSSVRSAVSAYFGGRGSSRVKRG